MCFILFHHLMKKKYILLVFLAFIIPIFASNFAYVKAVKQLAEEENCLLIDNFGFSKDILEWKGTISKFQKGK